MKDSIFVTADEVTAASDAYAFSLSVDYSVEGKRYTTHSYIQVTGSTYSGYAECYANGGGKANNSMYALSRMQKESDGSVVQSSANVYNGSDTYRARAQISHWSILNTRYRMYGYTYVLKSDGSWAYLFAEHTPYLGRV